jgi:hypothetical protein
LRGEYPVAEQGYENAIWLLQSLLDEVMYETGVVPEDEKASVEKGECRASFRQVWLDWVAGVGVVLWGCRGGD